MTSVTGHIDGGTVHRKTLFFLARDEHACHVCRLHGGQNLSASPQRPTAGLDLPFVKNCHLLTDVHINYIPPFLHTCVPPLCTQDTYIQQDILLSGAAAQDNKHNFKPSTLVQ